jgi:hypothetical protein
VTESRLVETLETKYDHAYCTGVPRFGHDGEFPYEKFVVFDCTTTLDDRTCFGQRYQTVKYGGWFAPTKAHMLKTGRCY